MHNVHNSPVSLQPTAALSETYEAICAGTKCRIDISAEAITFPYGSIPTKRVTYWGGGGGDSKTSIGTGIATTVLLGGIGLLGFWQRIMITTLLLMALILRVNKQLFNFSLKIVDLQKDLCRKCLWSQI